MLLKDEITILDIPVEVQRILFLMLRSEIGIDISFGELLEIAKAGHIALNKTRERV